MAGMPTIFTKIIEGEIPGRFVWQDDRVVAFLTVAPIVPGHTLVVPRAEIDDWTAIDPDLLGHVMKVCALVGEAVKKAFDAPRAGLVIAGFEVPHAHVHVFPAHDMTDFDFGRADPDTPAAQLDAAHERVKAVIG
jgi:diadenosine tetraphosphate (Ap4A) HIT family hydrolase